MFSIRLEFYVLRRISIELRSLYIVHEVNAWKNYFILILLA